ncbi:MAG: hypothetical protein M1480_01305, partial [Bacteroidetes bacterium]|nr:hypothetical protein [Bacteroidota bacterium]
MKTIIKNYIFFLGGYDAEMLEIKDILTKHNIHFYDKKLQWDNAKISAYKNEISTLKENEIPVLIELLIDVELPQRTVIVDHHNESESKPSSIEQIAELLGIELNRWQKLIAANDKGYIPAMKDLCASENEIKQIRELDRREQGVTEQDEKLAEDSIEKNREEKNGFTIIESFTEKFSPITDRLYGKTNNLLICTNEVLTYYGEMKKQIVNKFKNLVDEGKAYYGGKDFGFFGLAKGKVTQEEIIGIKNEILEMKPEISEKLYSHHIFIFPFKWEKWNTGSETTLKDNFDIKFFSDELKNNNWINKPFEINSPDQYNEYNYFYDYVREILYDVGGALVKTDNKDKLITHFEYKIKEGTYYNIRLYTEGITYNLVIDSILLNVYSTGTAVLSFHLRNHKYSDKRDILKINKFGRRLYVPFFDLDPDSIFTGHEDKTNVDQLLRATKKYEIPDSIWIGKPELDEKDKNLFEDFEKYKDKSNYVHGPFLLPKFIEGLFPQNFILINEQKGYSDKESKIKDEKYKIHISPVLDDRMHVVCWYGNTELVNELNQIKKCNDFDLGADYLNDNRESKKYYSFEKSDCSDWWYCYIFNDSGKPMHTDRFVKQKLLKEQTYSRWVECGTLFGISRFSFVMLTKSFSDLEKYDSTFLVRHLQSMYYKMAELCLMQRATVLSFSDEVTHVSNLLSNDKEEKITNRINELYKHYILFVNKIYFREVTAQEQGIEIYDMMQKIMRIPSDVKDLDTEIGELNQFASMQEEKNETKAMQQQAKEANDLTRVATLLLIPALIAGLLGMNVLPSFEKIPLFLFSGNPVWPFYNT